MVKSSYTPKPQTFAALVAGIPCECVGDKARSFVGLFHDSRLVTPQGCFIAIAGGRVDGHNFVAEVVRRGCAGLVLSRKEWPKIAELLQRDRASVACVVIVEDTRDVLATMAGNVHAWPTRAMKLAGITGTNGKSTTTHLLGSILSEHNLRHVCLGTTGHWLVDHEVESTHTTPFPLELAELFGQARDRGASHGVMEVASHALAQRRIEGLGFECVALTSFTQDHLDFHSSMEDYLAAKCLLPSQYLAQNGVAIVHGNAPGSQAFAEAARRHGRRVWTISRDDPKSEFYCHTVRASLLGMQATIETSSGTFDLRTPLLGDYNLDNAMVAFAAALALELPAEPTLQALARAIGAPGRLQRIAHANAAKAPTVLVDYAHTPDAIGRALQALRPFTQGKLWIVVGCGGDRDRKKRPMMANAAQAHADFVVATSDNPRTEDPRQILEDFLAGLTTGPNVFVQPDRRAAIHQAIAQAETNDVVLIAGKGHETYQIIGHEKIDFDDRVEAALALDERATTS